MPSGSSVRWFGRSLLLVDPQAAPRRHLSRRLEAAGWEVVAAAGCHDALCATVSGVPQCAVVEQFFRDGTAMHLIRQLRALRPDVRVLVRTRYPSIVGAQLSLNAGAVSFTDDTTPAERLAALLHVSGTASLHPLVCPAPGPLSLSQYRWEKVLATVIESSGSLLRAAKALSIDYRTLRRTLARGRPGW